MLQTNLEARNRDIN